MSSETSFTVEGLPELRQSLEGLPREIRDQALAKAVRGAGEMVRDAVSQAAPLGATGRLKKSIVFRATQVGGTPSGVVVPNRKKGGGGHHAHLVEGGTQPHASKYYGHPAQHPGTSARPFFHPTVDSIENAATSLMVQQCDSVISAYWERQGGAE